MARSKNRNRKSNGLNTMAGAFDQINRIAPGEIRKRLKEPRRFTLEEQETLFAPTPKDATCLIKVREGEDLSHERPTIGDIINAQLTHGIVIRG